MLSRILGQSSFWIINKALAKEVGLEAALLLSDLIDKKEYFVQRGELDNEGFFYNTADNIEKDTGLSKYKQRKAIKILQEKGFIETKLKGIPARTYYKIFEDKILNFLKTSCKKNGKQVIKKFATNNNKKIIIKNNNKKNIYNIKQKTSLKNSEKENKTKTSTAAHSVKMQYNKSVKKEEENKVQYGNVLNTNNNCGKNIFLSSQVKEIKKQEEKGKDNEEWVQKQIQENEKLKHMTTGLGKHLIMQQKINVNKDYVNYNNGKEIADWIIEERNKRKAKNKKENEGST